MKHRFAIPLRRDVGNSRVRLHACFDVEVAREGSVDNASEAKTGHATTPFLDAKVWKRGKGSVSNRLSRYPNQRISAAARLSRSISAR